MANHHLSSMIEHPGISLLRAALFLLLGTLSASAQVKITIDRNAGPTGTPAFKFKTVPSPVKDDAAAGAKLALIAGELDPNGADLGVLTDGRLPEGADQPSANLFFTAGGGGGRIRMDLNSVIEIAQINSYSWHPNTRGAQLYQVWGSDGTDAKFNPAPGVSQSPSACGWKLIATVDTRSGDSDNDGGQYGVSITDAGGILGKYRYLLFDLYVTETADYFGNTFYSEIDVISKKQ